jgi:antitoxin ParD1/3/4
MTIQLRPELEQLIQKDIERGGYHSVEQFVERAIQLLHDEEYLLQESKHAIHEAIGDGLAQLDRGEGVPGEVSRANLQQKKAAWIDAHKPCS